MTRLLMTVDAVGGVWRYAIDLSDALRDHGVDVVLAVLGPAPDADARTLVADGVRVIDTGLPLDWLCRDADAVMATGRALADFAREVGADLVQLNSPALNADQPFGVPVVAAAHGCVATWWRAARGDSVTPDLAWHAELMRKGLLEANAVVVPSAAFATDLVQTYDLPTAPVAVFNGRRPSALVGEAVAAHAFTAGRLWDEVKGTAVLDRAAEHLAVPLHAAGPVTAPHGESVSPAHLRLCGTLSSAAVEAELAQRPVYVSAARFEPFGLAVLEAAQAGCPLVLSDIPTFRELWDGVASFVDAADDRGFADAITRIVADPALHDRLGCAAAERAALYTPDRTAGAMATLYGQLLGTPTARAA